MSEWLAAHLYVSPVSLVYFVLASFNYQHTVRLSFMSQNATIAYYVNEDMGRKTHVRDERDCSTRAQNYVQRPCARDNITSGQGGLSTPPSCRLSECCKCACSMPAGALSHKPVFHPFSINALLFISFLLLPLSKCNFFFRRLPLFLSLPFLDICY